MKTRAFLSLLLATLGLPFVGCKKSEEPKSQSGSGTAARLTRSQEPVDLKIKWPVGGRFAQRMEVVNASESFVPTSPESIRQDVTMNQEFTIAVLKERTGGGRELELQFGNVDMSVMMGGKEMMTFDSRIETDAAENPETAAFRTLVGAKIKFFTDASNKVEKVEGAQELTQRMTSNAPGQAGNVLAGMMNEDYFKQMVDFGGGFPSKPVKPGDSWPVQRDIGMGPMGGGTLDLTYTFKGWEVHEKRECARLEYTGTLNSKPGDGKGTGPMGMKMSINDGRISGHSWYDPAQEIVVESVIDQNMTVVLTVPSRPGPGGRAPAGGMVITNLMDQKITIMLTPDGGK